jgi:hypothetical protein
MGVRYRAAPSSPIQLRMWGAMRADLGCPRSFLKNLQGFNWGRLTETGVIHFLAIRNCAATKSDEVPRTVPPFVPPQKIRAYIYVR